MFGLGGSEILVILIVALIFISPDKLPEIAQWLGRTVWKVKHTAEEFRKEVAIPSLGLDSATFKSEIQELRELNASIKRGLHSPLTALVTNLLEEEKDLKAEPKLCEGKEPEEEPKS